MKYKKIFICIVILSISFVDTTIVLSEGPSNDDLRGTIMDQRVNWGVTNVDIHK